MLRRHGVRLVVPNANMQSVAAGRFFGLFYRWSRPGCLGASTGRRSATRGFHEGRRYLRERLRGVGQELDNGKTAKWHTEMSEVIGELGEKPQEVLHNRSSPYSIRYTNIGMKEEQGEEDGEGEAIIQRQRQETKEEQQARKAAKKTLIHQTQYAALKEKRRERARKLEVQTWSLPPAKAARLQMLEKIRLENIQKAIEKGRERRQRVHLAKQAKRVRENEQKAKEKEERKARLERAANKDGLEESIRALGAEDKFPEDGDAEGVPYSMLKPSKDETKSEPSLAVVEQQQPKSQLFAPFSNGHEYFQARIEGRDKPLSPTEGSNAQPQDTPSSSKTKESEADESTKAKPELPKISENLRTVMRALPASVVVVTTALTTSARSKGKNPDVIGSDLTVNARGMAVSSFTTVTLDPHPIIQFNVKAPSRTLDALMETRHFLVHIIEASKEGAIIAAAFTKGNAPDHNPFHFPADYKVKPTVVEVRKWEMEKDGMYIRPLDWRIKKAEEEKGAWKLVNKFDPPAYFKRPPNFKKDNYHQRKPIVWDPPTPDEKLQDAEQARGTQVVLPRLKSAAILRTLQCKVLDKGARGGRGDGFVHVGDHVMVLARVYDIIGHFPVENIAKGNLKALAYAHGSFTATRSTIATEAPGANFTPARPIPEDEQPETEKKVKRPFWREKKMKGEGGETEMSPDRLLALLKEQAVQRETRKDVTESDRDLIRQQGERLEPHASHEGHDLDSKAARPDELRQSEESEAEMEYDGHYWAHDNTPSYEVGSSADDTAEAMRAASLRKMNELTDRYKSRTDSLRQELSLPGELEAVSESPEPVYPEIRGPRIAKHFSNSEFSLPDIKTAANISKDFGIPRRISEAAIKALPDADEETRKNWAVLRAAEELDIRRKQIEDQREAAKANFAVEKLPSAERARRRDFNKPVQIIKYGLPSAKLDPETSAKMVQVWQKVDRFKVLNSGLNNSEDEQDGLFWRPEHVVKNQKIEKVREEYYKDKGVTPQEVLPVRDPKEDKVERFTIQDLENIEQRKARRRSESGEEQSVLYKALGEIHEPRPIVSEEEITRKERRKAEIKEHLQRELRAGQRKREKAEQKALESRKTMSKVKMEKLRRREKIAQKNKNKEERIKATAEKRAKKRVYEEADPWADEFI